MRVIVVHEDGDRSSRTMALADEIRTCVENGTLHHQGVTVKIQNEDALQ